MIFLIKERRKWTGLKIPESHNFEDIQVQSMSNLIWLNTVDSKKDSNHYTTTGN